MSTDSIRIHCNGCDYEYLESFVPITLKCQMGDEVAVYHRTTAWCNQCETIRYVEYIPSLDELQQEYEKLTAPPPEEPPPGWAEKLFFRVIDFFFKSDNSFNAKDWQQEQISNQKNLISWRQARTAPPHCLTCGATDINRIEYEQINESVRISKTFRHSCGGALVVDSKDDPGIRINFARAVIWMDIEGNKLRDGDYER